MHAVVLALELDDFIAAGVAAGNAQGVHGRFGARVGKAHQLDTGAQADDPLGDLRL